MATHRGTWKARERQIAAYFGSERTPLSGGNSKHTRSDTLSSVFYVEAKFRKNQPVLRLYEDTESKARKEGKIPIVALCEKGKSGFLLATTADNFKLIARRYMQQLLVSNFAKVEDSDE